MLNFLKEQKRKRCKRRKRRKCLTLLRLKRRLRLLRLVYFRYTKIYFASLFLECKIYFAWNGGQQKHVTHPTVKNG